MSEGIKYYGKTSLDKTLNHGILIEWLDVMELSDKCQPLIEQLFMLLFRGGSTFVLKQIKSDERHEKIRDDGRPARASR